MFDMTESAAGSLIRVFENFYPSVTGCGTFTTSSDAPYIQIALPTDSDISSVMVQGNNLPGDKWQIKKIIPEVLDSNGLW